MQLKLPESIVPAQFTPTSNDSAFEPSSAAQITSLVAETRELKGQIESLRAERAAWIEVQRRLMDLLRTQAPEKLVHDLRNLLNERDLLKTLVDQM